MIRTWIKRTAACVLVLAVLLMGVHLGLRVLSHTDWINRVTAEKIAAATGREVRLGRLSLGLQHVDVEDFFLAKEGGFEKGTDAHVHRLYLKFSWIHLLRGHVKIVTARIDGLSVQVVRDAHGKINWETAQDPAEDGQTEEGEFGLPVGLSVQELSFRDMRISYVDESIQQQVDLKDADLLVRNFSLDEPFDVRFNASVLLRPDGEERLLPLGLALQVNLADLELDKAQAALKDLSLRSGTARLHVSGQVTNFTDPVFSLRVRGKNLSQEILQGLVENPPAFTVPEVALSAQGALAPGAKLWRADTASLSMQGLDVSANGKGDWGRGTYSFSGTVKADLAQLEKQVELLKMYRPQGEVNVEAHGTQQAFSAQLDIKEGGAVFVQTGTFSEVAASFKGEGNMDGQQGDGALQLTGKLNAEPFELHAIIDQTPAKITLGLKASADRLVLPQARHASAAANEQAASPQENTAWPLPPMDINADVQIGSLDVPYLNGRDLNFKMDLSGVTPRLQETHGKFNLSIGNGVITDLYQLTSSNPLAKVLFLSLSVVGKVFNNLDVLSVLGGIAGGKDDKNTNGEEVVQMVMGEDGNPVAIKVPASSRKIEGSLPYDKFITDIRFDDGVATVEEGHFVSDMMSFKLSGTTDFNTEKLKMTVHAAPGKHETDGMMPLTIKIGGTVNEPQGSMSVMRSVTSLVAQGVTNNFASRAVKKSVGGFFGLFKKKTAPVPEPTAPAPDVPQAPEEQPKDETL